ncbi:MULTISPECIES: NADP-dependent oxidoreductase [Nocardia]|uniref:NADP-dependent oxidoreductase n=2 Tax=Nocardia TaxID=1817 RepID=A0A2T2ZCM4_9NOCA|nr:MULTISPECIES: NADP-dependent oxidoreductase [Nocardia]MBF6447565.1 NADP-dependent oxidoreductase [Nocardia elegans]PSR65490.1 NADP-dependent oxidoreductase [Nocardia nova]
MADTVNRQWILRRRPEGELREGDFELGTAPIPVPGPGEALVRVHRLGIDPTQRGWLNDSDNYIDAVPVGTVMRGSGVGQVVRSNTASYPEGSWVAGMVGWQDYVVASDGGLFGLNVVPDGVAPTLMLSLFGAPGLTAYFGMTDIGRPEPGRTVLVSAAAGVTGSIAGQIAKALGCTVIGIAGGPAKCTWITDRAGLHAAIDYKNDDVSAGLSRLAPDGVDVFFDGVGGRVLEHGLAHLAHGARVVLAGAISSGYSGADPQYGPRNYMQLAMRRARMEGFIFLDYLDRFPEAFAALRDWHERGELTIAETVSIGLESAPGALRAVFEGGNLGKQLVDIVES